jgi:hypothetical protein
LEFILSDQWVVVFASRKLGIKGGGDAKDDSALDLRLHRVRIDDRAAIDRANDAADADVAGAGDLDFGNLRQIGAEDELQRDAAATSLGRRLPPAGFFSSKVENGLARGALLRSTRR